MTAVITNGVEIAVESFYQDQHSQPERNRYVYAYRIRITNMNPFAIQLTERHWDIWNSNNVLKVVDGQGVIGEQPILEPGESHQYMSWCPLSSDMGYMKGFYKMVRVSDQMEFLVQIPQFNLVAPFRHN